MKGAREKSLLTIFVIFAMRQNEKIANCAVNYFLDVPNYQDNNINVLFRILMNYEI